MSKANVFLNRDQYNDFGSTAEDLRKENLRKGGGESDGALKRRQRSHESAEKREHLVSSLNRKN